jgi:hypothetical protein
MLISFLSDLVGFGFAVSGVLQIDDFLDPFTVKNAMATLSRAFSKSKVLQKHAKVIKAETLFLPNGEQLGFQLIPFGHRAIILSYLVWRLGRMQPGRVSSVAPFASFLHLNIGSLKFAKQLATQTRSLSVYSLWSQNE